MEVAGINKQSFKAMDTKAVVHTLYGRRLNGKSIKDMNELSMSQAHNPYNIVLKKGFLGSLKAEIISPSGEILYKAREKFYKGLFNNPIEFIQSLCDKANSLKKL